MSAIDGSVTVNMGDREVSLVLNGRAARLILEKTGVDVYRNARDLESLDASSLPVLLWALTQNKRNGSPDKWPQLEDIEELNIQPLVRFIFLAIVPDAKRKEAENLLERAEETPETPTLGTDTLSSGTSSESSAESVTPSGTNSQ